MKIPFKRLILVFALAAGAISIPTIAAAAETDAPAAAAEDAVVAEPAAAPAGAAAAETTTVIEAGTVLKVVVYRENDLSGSYKVDMNGEISLPLIGSVRAAGKSAPEVAAEIAQALKKFMINPQVTVSFEREEGPQGRGGRPGAPSSEEVSASSITVLGEVRDPGSYPYTTDFTLTKIIAKSGGFTPTADTGKIKIVRRNENGSQSFGVFDMERVNNGDTPDPELRPGDKILIPREIKDVNTVAILGQVKNAGVYDVTPGMTLMRIIAKSGGFTPIAAPNKVRIVREVSGEKKVYVYNAAVIINGQGDDPEIMPGDMVFVPESMF